MKFEVYTSKGQLVHSGIVPSWVVSAEQALSILNDSYNNAHVTQLYLIRVF